MCQIIVKDAGIDLPEEQELRNSYNNNNDGIGIAYKKPSWDYVRIKKDFNGLKGFLNFIRDNVNKEDKAIIHFRLATAGRVDKGNRHPYPITKNIKLLRQTDLKSRFAVAHNGVIYAYSHHNKLSDTQKFILDILASPKIKHNLKNVTIQKLLKKFLNDDKLAILTHEGDIILLGNFKEYKKHKYANNSYKEIKIVEFNWKEDKQYQKLYEYYTKHFSKAEKKNLMNRINGVGDPDYDDEGFEVEHTPEDETKCELCFMQKKNVRYYADWCLRACRKCRKLYIESGAGNDY